MHERPKLRTFLGAARDRGNAEIYFLYDRLGLAPEAIRLTSLELCCLEFFDGTRTLKDIHAEARKVVDGHAPPLDLLAKLVNKLDGALYLEGPKFREKLAEPFREPSCLGCYEAEPEALRRQMRSLFVSGKGPGKPGKPRPRGKLKAALIPHIDYARGGATYAWGFKELFEHTPASLFVIIGTSHYSQHRFTLTRKNFKTPLGIVPTDQAYIDRLVRHFGDGLFDDEIAHLPEHSIELEVVFLQYLYEKVRPIRIVPLVVGSFQDAVAGGSSPGGQADIARMIRALRQVEKETSEEICYVISGDLAHIGLKFGDPHRLDLPFLQKSQAQDRVLMEKAQDADPEAYFKVIAQEADERRICGFPPTYTLLSAIQPGRGKLLHYDQYVDPRGWESVSFASMAFYQ